MHNNTVNSDAEIGNVENGATCDDRTFKFCIIWTLFCSAVIGFEK
jgi:hypothetical protein